MAKTNYKVYGYRWVILAIFMLISIVIQLQWLAHAAVERPAEVFYHGQFNPDSFFNIDFLAMVYMLVYIIMSFPASYIIKRHPEGYWSRGGDCSCFRPAEGFLCRQLPDGGSGTDWIGCSTALYSECRNSCYGSLVSFTRKRAGSRAGHSGAISRYYFCYADNTNFYRNQSP